MNDLDNIFNVNIRTYVQIISDWLISDMKWEEIDVEESLIKKNFIIKESVLQKDYKKVGLYPIVSQSKDLISGYSDEKELLIDQNIPTIIFGDHTQVVKYIDFPFIIGADGVKILKPIDEYIPKFFYYLIKSIDLNSSKYARHYKNLRLQKIPYKDKSFIIQEKIVSFLDDLQNNSLREVIYFDNKIESKILQLHQFILNNNYVIHENEKQSNIISQLKQAILQEAISGQLTAEWRKQNPIQKGDPDTDAAALLAKIKAEKQQLIADGKLKKEKPLSEISPDEIPFSLPDSWVWCRLVEIADGFEYGSSSKSLKAGKIPVLRMGNIQNGLTDLTNLVYTNEEKEIDQYALFYGDLLFNRTNSRELVGKTSLFLSDKKMIYAGYLVRYRMLGEISFFYTNYVMNSKLHREWCNTVKSDAIGQSNINATKLRSFCFPLPPHAEQKAIVEKVDYLMKIIDQLEAQIKHRKQLAEDLMQTVLREAFV
ncbi:MULTISPECIES: restriction endonuclease subunit S [unclassified Anabaena]|uniref:restriction endonuclease subunit S n=1 Tax=unclassified Anabaena TaxID=2619674 RepID=UPI0014489902|nr:MULTISPECIES: restriction endonuclease subunit S [unclassified Anabaena]MTJ09402.1 hypothetical protein [Anabaena sp. UHCC 0204]MTJ55517.1 hypothetical protein [Anabaena sp. UHCC 0253]